MFSECKGCPKRLSCERVGERAVREEPTQRTEPCSAPHRMVAVQSFLSELLLETEVVFQLEVADALRQVVKELLRFVKVVVPMTVMPIVKLKGRHIG